MMPCYIFSISWVLLLIKQKGADQNVHFIDLLHVSKFFLGLLFRTNTLLLSSRYIMLRGVSGFYTYSILEHEKDWPGFEIAELRLAFKLNGER
jgi:Rhamnogalacturonate lyase family